MILCNNQCHYSLVTSLGCLFHKQVRYVEQQNVTSCENVSMLSASLKIFLLEEIQGKYAKVFIRGANRMGTQSL